TTTYSLAPTAVALLRFNANGTPDITNLVGGTGLVTTDVNAFRDDLAFAVVRQPADGKIIAVGTSFTTPASIVVIRYKSGGTLDSTFGSGGIVTTPVGSLDADAAALAVQTDGKIVAAGLAGSFASQIWDVALLRYNTDGTLDLPFGGTNTGMVITDIGSSSNYANAVAIQGDGKIVVVGNAFVNSFAGTSDIAVLRYNTDGSPDTAGFGIPNGYVTTNVSAFDNGFAVAVQPDNN